MVNWGRGGWNCKTSIYTSSRIYHAFNVVAREARKNYFFFSSNYRTKLFFHCPLTPSGQSEDYSFDRSFRRTFHRSKEKKEKEKCVKRSTSSIPEAFSFIRRDKDGRFHIDGLNYKARGEAAAGNKNRLCVSGRARSSIPPPPSFDLASLYSRPIHRATIDYSAPADNTIRDSANFILSFRTARRTRRQKLGQQSTMLFTCLSRSLLVSPLLPPILFHSRLPPPPHAA